MGDMGDMSASDFCIGSTFSKNNQSRYMHVRASNGAMITTKESTSSSEQACISLCFTYHEPTFLYQAFHCFTWMQLQHQFIQFHIVCHTAKSRAKLRIYEGCFWMPLRVIQGNDSMRLHKTAKNLRSHTPRTISGARPQQISRHSTQFSLAVPSCRSATSVTSDLHHDKNISFPPTATEKHYNDGRIEIYIIHSLPLTVLNSYTLTYLLKPFAWFWMVLVSLPGS